eukprot:3203477-Amphidinium_carterae.1
MEWTQDWHHSGGERASWADQTENDLTYLLKQQQQQKFCHLTQQGKWPPTCHRHPAEALSCQKQMQLSLR